jgi:arsenate reductase
VITLWHNPRCSKSRAALALLQEAGAPLTLCRYLEDAPDLAELRRVQALLGGDVIDMMRSNEARFKELGLTRKSDDEVLVAAMAENPILIERPIAITATRAIIGRPPEQVLDLL